MGKFCFIILLVTASLFAYSQDMSTKIIKAHTQISEKSVIASFMSNLTNKNYQGAFSLITPKLTEAWTFERFKKDLEIVRAAVPDWKPESTSSFTGNAPQGTYIQATYKLDSSWKSSTSIDLIAMSVNNKNRIVRIQVRIPYSKETPKAAEEITKLFISAMQEKDYEAARALMTTNCKLRFKSNVLAYMQSILGDKSSKASPKFFRMNANSVWYNTVNISSTTNAASYIELIISEQPKPKIVSLNFKGRM